MKKHKLQQKVKITAEGHGERGGARKVMDRQRDEEIKGETGDREGGSWMKRGDEDRT